LDHPERPVAVHQLDRRQTRAERKVPLPDAFQLSDIVFALAGKGDAPWRVKEEHQVGGRAGSSKELKIQPFAQSLPSMKREQRVIRIPVEHDQ